jgi:hypothetical protein
MALPASQVAAGTASFLGAALVAAAVPATLLTHRAATTGNRQLASAGLALSLGVAAALLRAAWAVFGALPFALGSHAHGAIVGLLLIYRGLHVALELGGARARASTG